MTLTHWLIAERLVARLFRTRWRDLLKDRTKLADGKYPGVYLLAYDSRNLLGKRVSEKHVFYVGMSHAGVSKRLKQFLDAIEKGKGHSAGNRFFRDRTKGRGYSRMRKKKSFLVASLPIPCKTKKRRRQPEDLRKMGLVAALEYYCLARIRKKTGQEPKLNEK